MYEEIALIADYIIIMKHDFDDKDLQSGYVGNSIIKTPLSPIDKIECDINTLIKK